MNSKNFFYKSCSVWYSISEFLIKSESLAFIWSQSRHFSLSKLNIISKNLFYKNCSVCAIGTINCFCIILSNYLLFVAWHFSLPICYFISDDFYLKPAIPCKNLFPFAPVVRLVIFFIILYDITSL